MQHHSTGIRGVLALPLSGLIGIVSIFLRGPFIDPSSNPLGFAQAAHSSYTIAGILGIVSTILTLIGFVGLYLYLANSSVERSAFWGMVFSLVGSGIVLALIGVFVWVMPVIGQLYLQGQKDVMAVAIGSSGALFLASALLSGLTASVGAIGLGLAMWRCGTLPKWSTLLYVVSIPLFYFAPPMPFIVESIGFAMFLVAGCWIAYSILLRETTAKQTQVKLT